MLRLGAIVIQMKFDVLWIYSNSANWIGSLQMIKYYDENVKHQGFFQSM